MMDRNWRALIRPKNLELDDKGDTGHYAKFVARPLERGFGITLGNSLRRVLLSSLQGAAIVSVRVDGILHEFSTIPGAVEDFTEVILNLKGVLIRLEGEEQEKTLVLEKSGAGELRAGDIRETTGVTVLNPDHYIATLNHEANFRAEIVVRTGRGWSSCSRNKDPDAPIGTVPIDAIFSPVKKVTYTVADARVGQITDYDKLTLQLWTDGSVTPLEAVDFAARILQDQLNVFVNVTEGMFEQVAEEEEAEDTDEWNENLFKTVEELELSVRSANCLQNANIKYIYELVERTEAEMLKTKNFGRKSLNEIKEILSEMGLALGMKLGPTFPRARD
jgi:DNA-directed RNA polymerase subunit alpha